ncbi:LysR family transcriptional regulator [Frateuria aurantia]|uniref:Transcriptional regulator n=1 Tax=Frateuria aurantia (strain ATCC 33424 / DSM 6220 / KCTC 2777 / LMG 1558 / NBRC 3245 / NCIMB 13370) TaxID=767434 RepID=H8L4J8_FRAAD|nr:LysR family transcriptional regulator [Frateuria aurantia]AFC85672.1 transcriptional regulator [Frateuria aurantia DSM 6220]
MAREHYSELLALIEVAQECSFTRAATNLGMSQSMLSHTIREMEARLGVRLLTRTTRSVSVTEAGERLLKVVTPRMKDIASELRSVAESGTEPSGTLRFTATDHAIDTLLWPKLAKILPAYPEIKVELSVDYAFSDIVQGRYDFGVRLAEELGKDVAAVRIGPDVKFMIVAAPSYLERNTEPSQPQQLLDHDCINLRLSTRGNLCTWQLKRGQREMDVEVGGKMVFNGFYQLVNAAVSGFGLAYVPQDLAKRYIEAGQLLPVLKPWWRKFPGYHLFYARQRETSRAMQVMIEALRAKR